MDVHQLVIVFNYLFTEPPNHSNPHLDHTKSLRFPAHGVHAAIALASDYFSIYITCEGTTVRTLILRVLFWNAASNDLNSCLLHKRRAQAVRMLALAKTVARIVWFGSLQQPSPTMSGLMWHLHSQDPGGTRWTTIQHGDGRLQKKQRLPASSNTTTWTLQPARKQIDVPKNKRTHDRPPPLPFTVDLVLDEELCRGQYAGHGLTKTTYLLFDIASNHKWKGKILKLRPVEDAEPRIFGELADAGVYPRIYAQKTCVCFNSAAQPAEWYAWVTDRATPLDQYIRLPGVDVHGCIRGAVCAMLRAALARRSHLLSDNGLYNFGVIEDKVVIIDAGSRDLVSSKPTKGHLNEKVIKSFWKKACLFVQNLDTVKNTWQSEPSIESALTAYEASSSSSSLSQAARPALALPGTQWSPRREQAGFGKGGKH